MIALQIVRAVLKNPEDKTELSLIFGNVEERDILLRDELEEYEERHDNFSCYHTLNKVFICGAFTFFVVPCPDQICAFRLQKDGTKALGS